MAKHNGAASIKYYEEPDTIALFEPVRVWLNKTHKKVRWCHVV